jgi:hypothetical protein
VDYHARIGRDTLAHIEVKRVGRPLKPEMILKYVNADAAAARHVFGILTNGAEWQVWLGGRLFATAGVHPVHVLSRSVLGEGDERAGRIGDVADRLLRLSETMAFRGCASRWLDYLTDRNSRAPERLLRVLSESPRVVETWRRAYASAYTGRVPNPRMRLCEADSSERVAPSSVAAALAMRGYRVAKVVNTDLRRLLGAGRVSGNRNGVRTTRAQLKELYGLPGE